MGQCSMPAVLASERRCTRLAGRRVRVRLRIRLRVRVMVRVRITVPVGVREAVHARLQLAHQRLGDHLLGQGGDIGEI